MNEPQASQPERADPRERASQEGEQTMTTMDRMPPNPFVQDGSSRPQALDAYLAIDFTPNGEFHNGLIASVEPAVRQTMVEQKVYLTGLTGETPPFLTPTMDTWYKRIAARRNPAMESIRNAFGEDSFNKGARGQLAEAEIDRAQDEYLEARKRFVVGHRLDKRAQYQELEQLKQDESFARHAYAQMRSELGDREPKMLSVPIYLVVLCLIGIAEALLNFESFNALKWATPAIALGMTLLVAAGLAFASHCHGTLLKQWEYYFGAHQEDISRGRAMRLFGLGTTSFLFAMAAVYYARDTYLSDMMNVRLTMGGEADINPLWVIGGSLLGNVIVYVVGAIIAYLMHDPNPEYPEKKRELDGIEKERQALQTKLDGMRQRELERLEAVLQKQRQRIKSLESLQKRSPLYARNRQWFAELQQQDANLLAALQDFKDRYIAALGEAGTATFYWRNEDDEQIALSPAQFHGLPVKLKYGHV